MSERLHQSTAHVLVAKSPLHARYRLDNQVEPTEPMLRGIIVDRLLFGVGPEIAEIEADDYRSKAAREARDAARKARKIPVLAEALANHRTTADAIRANLRDEGIILSGESQVEVEWTSPLGVLCAGRMDHLIFQGGRAIILDLKTTVNAHPDAVTRSLVDHGADIQRAAYTEAIETLHPAYAGRVDMLFLFAEIEPPYAITVAECAGTMRALGEFKWEKAQRIWQQCLRTNRWPGYGRTSIEAKPWQMTEAMEESDVIQFS